MSERIIKYTEALKEATEQMMEVDSSIVVLGLGVSYKNGADGTTAGLKVKYPERIFDVPVSEAGVTSMAVGAAINGLHPVVHHGRVEFALLAADAMFTQAAKWNYMFGGSNPVPIVIRINVGRQWGNGPQHTQALYSLFGNVPGLKVVIPSSPYMAKGLLVSALKEQSPVIILEPRWLFNLKQHVPLEVFSVELHRAHVINSGKDITVISYGDGLQAAREALELVGDHVSVELIDLVSINPIDYQTIITSVIKTGAVLTVDTTNESFNVGSEIIGKIVQEASVTLTRKPMSLSCPNVPCPTSTSLTESYYPTRVDIANSILKAFDKPLLDTNLTFEELHMAPAKTI